MSNSRTAYRPMSPDEISLEQKRINLALKYELLLDYSDSDNIDDKIMDLSDQQFCSMTKQFDNKVKYLEAKIYAEECIGKGEEIPQEMWDRIKQIRQDYVNYIK